MKSWPGLGVPAAVGSTTSSKQEEASPVHPWLRAKDDQLRRRRRSLRLTEARTTTRLEDNDGGGLHQSRRRTVRSRGAPWRGALPVAGLWAHAVVLGARRSGAPRRSLAIRARPDAEAPMSLPRGCATRSRASSKRGGGHHDLPHVAERRAHVDANRLDIDDAASALLISRLP